MTEEAFNRLCQFASFSRPEQIEVLPEYRSVHEAASLGGKRRMELHGPLGNLESHQKGGLATIARLRASRKTITKPPPSELLAEFMGIMLGDGGRRNSWQITVSYNWREDREYAAWLCQLIQQLFSLKPTYVVREQIGAADLLISSAELVDFLTTLGFPQGHKLRSGLTIPKWIINNPQYRLACVRGLMDTDGSVYVHKYRVNGVAYQYTKLCFSSASQDLLQDISRILADAGYSPRVRERCLYLDGSRDVDRYFIEVGTHNPRYQRRYEDAKKHRGRIKRLNEFGEVPERPIGVAC